MSPSEQAEALELLRRWLNAITDVERENVETLTRTFLVDYKIQQHQTAAEQQRAAAIWGRLARRAKA